MATPLLRAEHLSRSLAGEVPVTLVKDASLTIQPGEFVVITGPSGSGKSSLLYLLGLLDIPGRGKLWIEDTEATALTIEARDRLRLNKLGFVFQFHFLLPEFTALENVTLPMRRLGILSSKEMDARATELLTSLGLKDQIHKFPKQLSGGQSQRVAIARALANDPLLLLADEPTGNLDTHSSEAVQDILRSLAHERNRAVVAVTHDMAFAESADRIIHIVDGEIVRDGANM